jgi:hypothetical protein
MSKEVFRQSFGRTLKKEAASLLTRDLLAGADMTGTLPFEAGIADKRNQVQHASNIAASGFVVGGVTGMAQGGFVLGGAQYLGNKENRRKSILRKVTGAVEAGMRGGINSVKSLKHLAKPALRGPGKSKFLGAIGGLALGGSINAVMQANQYRLGQRARDHIETEIADKDRRAWARARGVHASVPSDLKN